MGSLSIPVRLTLADLSATALAEAAAALATADDPNTFLTALENNHHLWRLLLEVAQSEQWATPDQRLADFVLAVSRKCGTGVCDDDIEALIGINRDLASRLIEGRDPARIRQRAELAWREAESRHARPLLAWLADEMARKTRCHRRPPPPRPISPGHETVLR